MKKRFMLVAVLLGSLALASCVDDKESDSVTAIRNAKVERLKAAAALDYANAAREQAEAAIKQAKAEYDKEELAARLEMIKADYAANIEQYKAEAISSKNTALNNASTLLTNAYGKYEDAVGKLQGLNGTLIEKEVDLALATADSSKAEQTFKETMRQQELIIAQKKAQIERLNELAKVEDDKDALKKELDDLAALAYTLEHVDKAKAQEAIDDAEEKQAEAYALIDPNVFTPNSQPVCPSVTYPTRPTVDEPGAEPQPDWYADNAEYQEAHTRWVAQRNHYQEAWEEFYTDEDTYYREWKEYYSDYAKYVMSLYDQVAHDNGLTDYVANAFVLNSYISRVPGEHTPFFKIIDEKITIEESPLTEDLYVFEPAAASDFEASRLAVVRHYEGLIARVQENIGSPATEEVDATGIESYIQEKATALKEAKEALKAAQEEDEPNANRIAELQRLVEDAQVALMRAEESKERELEFIKDYEEKLADFKESLVAVAVGGDNEKAYQAALEECVAATQEVLKAKDAWNAVNEQIAEIGITGWNGTSPASYVWDGAYQQLSDLYYGTADIKKLIAECEAAIADAEKVIAKGASMSSGSISTGSWSSSFFTGSPADIIELLQMEIDILKEKITLQEAIVAEYKAALEAIINGEE